MRPIDLLLCVRYSIVYIVLHKETLESPSGVLATPTGATALLVTYVHQICFSAAKSQVSL